MRAARGPPARGLAQHRGRRADFELRSLLENARRDALPRKRVLDEDDLAIGPARNAAAFGVERLDLENQFFQSDRNSRQCVSGRFSSTLRKSAHSEA